MIENCLCTSWIPSQCHLECSPIVPEISPLGRRHPSANSSAQHRPGPEVCLPPAHKVHRQQCHVHIGRIVRNRIAQRVNLHCPSIVIDPVVEVRRITPCGTIRSCGDTWTGIKVAGPVPNRAIKPGLHVRQARICSAANPCAGSKRKEAVGSTAHPNRSEEHTSELQSLRHL